MRKLFCLFFILAISFTANANIISYTDSITGLFDQVPSLDLLAWQFDPSLGTLNNVTIDLSTAIQGSVGVENLVRFTGGNYNINIQNHAVLVVQFEGSGMIYSNYTDSRSYTVSLSAFDGTIDYAGTSGTTVATYSDADNQTYTIGPDPRFIGTDILHFTLYTEANTDHLGMPSNFAAIANTTGQASVTITYDYTPIPEPATIVILSLCGLLLKRKIA